MSMESTGGEQSVGYNTRWRLGESVFLLSWTHGRRVVCSAEGRICRFRLFSLSGDC